MTVNDLLQHCCDLIVEGYGDVEVRELKGVSSVTYSSESLDVYNGRKGWRERIYTTDKEDINVESPDELESVPSKLYVNIWAHKKNEVSDSLFYRGCVLSFV